MNDENRKMLWLCWNFNHSFLSLFQELITLGNVLLLFPTQLLTSEDEYKWFWHQMIYFPGTINIVSTRLYCHTIYINNGFNLRLPAMHVTYSVHAGILKLWRGRLPCPLVAFSSHYVSRLSSSFVRSQLTLPVPTMGIRLPPPQNGAPIRRVRTHSLVRVQDTYVALLKCCHIERKLLFLTFMTVHCWKISLKVIFFSSA